MKLMDIFAIMIISNIILVNIKIIFIFGILHNFSIFAVFSLICCVFLWEKYCNFRKKKLVIHNDKFN